MPVAPRPPAEEAQRGATARGRAYLALHSLTGSRLAAHYRRFIREDRARGYRSAGERLGEVLRHAVESVPHYEGIVSAAAATADPLRALKGFPVLTREAVHQAGERLHSQAGARRDWQRNTSGGSTGEPVELVQDADHRARTVAAREVYSTWVGGRLGTPELYIWGSERDVEGAGASWRNRVGNRLLRRSLLNAFMLDEGAIRRIVEEVRSGPPRLVVAYAQAGYEASRFAAEQGIEIPPQRALIATAGTLYDFMREQLEETFGCPVVNRYGSREVGDIAGECLHRRGLHVLPWCSHVEVLDDDDRPVGPGEEGDVVVTGLTNLAMPLIRYRIGDRATLPEGSEPCPCGRATPMLAGVTGRSVDMFVGEGGRLVDGEYFTHLLYFRPWLRQFQVVQTARDRVVYRLATRAALPEGERAELIEKTRLALGDRCAVEFELVEAIAPSPSGKLRYTMREF
jgi:phenylacetate-CoA ligase